MSGSPVHIKFGLSNRAARAIRVIGASSGCTNFGCWTVEGLPLDIPVDETRTIVITILTRGQGRFSNPVTIYTDYDDGPSFVIWVEGRVI